MENSAVLGSRYSGLEKRRQRSLVFFIIPLMIFLLFLVFVPIAYLLNLSFRGWVLTRPGSNQFVGFENYRRMLNDTRFWNSVRVALTLGFISVFFQMIFGFTLAYFINKLKKFKNLLRSLFILPMILPDVVIGIVWKILFTPDLGGINYYLRLLGLQEPNWLGEPGPAFVALITATTWQWFPFVLLTLSASLESLPADPFEAAKIDGVSKLQELRYLTLPMMRNSISVVLVLRVIFSLKYFGVIYTMTGGGPGIATEPMNYYAYNTSFQYNQAGYGAALGVTIFLIIMFLSIIIKRFNRE
jgi:multiple sugar transport system permease protein